MTRIEKEKTCEDIERMIKMCVGCCGKTASDYYIGITTDPERRLQEHNVDIETNCGWLFRAENETAAREVEKNFTVDAVQGWRMRGDQGGGTGDDGDVYYVYCYLVTTDTIQ